MGCGEELRQQPVGLRLDTLSGALVRWNGEHSFCRLRRNRFLHRKLARQVLLPLIFCDG